MQSKQQGFTLIELVIVIALTGIVMKFASQILVQGLNAYLTTRNVTDADWQGRLALERMTRDIRAVRSHNDISTASASQLIFTDLTGTAITYSLTGATLKRNTQVLADGINSLTFNYYDKNGTTTATLTAICYIKISLNVTQGNANFTIITTVYPRNLL